MLQRQITKLRNKLRSGLPDERGQSLIIFTFAILGLIAMLGIALDLGLVYIEQNRINRTTDAATLAAVVELPYEQDAINRAIEFIERNGYTVVGPGADTEILVRGCVDINRPYGSTTSAISVQNESENSVSGTEIATTTTTITGATYIASPVQPPRAVFMIDTGSYQAANGDGDDDEECNNAGTADLFGTASKIRVEGRVNVRMNFMQFFGFSSVPVQEVAVAQNVTNLDVVIVFDVSGSMESETTCYDCWVRTSYDPDFPNTNGYANPLPTVPNTNLCSATVAPYVDGSNNYLVHEAELYSREVGDWDFDARIPGQGFWVLQRGSRSNTNNNHVVLEADGTTQFKEPNWQRNQMGNPANQSSNVCRPAAGNVNCSLEDCNGSEDCSAFIKAHPYNVYGQQASAGPKLQGGAYDANCFSGSTLSGTCWSNKSSNPDYPAPSNVPYVEYDFTPTWSGNTSIWIRAIGGGEHAREWNGVAPTSLQNYRDSVFWQVDNSTILENSSVISNATLATESWRNNRADNSLWGWVRLGAVGTTANTQHTLKIYQGSAGYAIDKIIFTDDSSTSVPAAMQLNSGKGPPATLGSATREACNLCNPAFGLPVNTADCTCKLSASDTTNSGYGAGQGCTSVLVDGTNQLQDDLYAGIQPIRGAQEAVKRFIKRLDPKFDQVGFVAFTTNTINSGNSRSKLQCLRWAGQYLSGVDKCYDPASSPISYTNVLNAVERQWAIGGTDIAEGVREGLEELGVTGYSKGNSCSTTPNDGTSCDRSGSARRVMILLTDGSPNNNPDPADPNNDSSSSSGWNPSPTCDPASTGVDLWDGLVGPNDDAYECSMYYAWEAANNNVTLYAIGLGGGTNLDLLNAMATGVDPRGGILNDGNDVTYFNGRGGQAFNAATPDELDAIFDTILSNIYVRIVG